MVYFYCPTCESSQKGFLISSLSDYIKNIITNKYRCGSCNNETSASSKLPEHHRTQIQEDYQII